MDQSVGGGQFERQQCPLNTTISTAFQSLDTVRALHQTVVSLRTALEDAHKEIDNLKKQILIQTDIDDGKLFRLIQEPHINGSENQLQQHVEQQNQEQQQSVEPSQSLDNNKNNQIEQQQQQQEIIIRPTIETEQISINSVNLPAETDIPITPSSKKSAPSNSNKNLKIKSSACKFTYDVINQKSSSQLKNEKYTETIIEPNIRVINSPRIRSDTFTLSTGDKKRKQMASKIDVKIKVSSNIKVNESGSSTTTDTCSDNAKDTTDQSQSDDQTSASDSAERDDNDGESSQLQDINNKDDDAADIHMTSQENINVIQDQHRQGITITKSSTENINIDNLSVTSLSEGDNSVFGDDDGPIEMATDKKVNAKLATQSTSSELHGEEVDDIELIFSSDDKEFPQEDLVSISEYEPWGKAGASGTPVLVNFSAIPSSGEEQDDNESKQMDMAQDDENVSDGQRYDRQIDGQIESNSDYLYTDDNNSQGKDDEQNDNNLSRRDENFDTFDPIGNTNTTMGRRWTNYNVLIETDISKCGIAEENILEMGRRNTCPNPPAYRPILHREALGQQSRHSSVRCPLTSKFSRINRTQQYPSSRSTRPILSESNRPGPKRSSSAQTEISALPEHWRSESHLAGGRYGAGMCTLPSKFVPPPGMGCHRYPLRISDKTQEVRRALLSDINFTSMVPELSRSADHLCPEEDHMNENAEAPKRCYYKGTHLTTPDYSRRGITPSVSLTSPGVSQWTVNENSYGTQTTQTDPYWGIRGDSFDSSKSYSMSSKYSNILDKSHRSRSVPSIRCAICKQNHGGYGLRASESMHYTPRVTFQEPTHGGAHGVRGSLPDLRNECTCAARRSGRSMLRIYGDSSGSTESLLDEADDFLRKSMDGVGVYHEDDLYAKRPNSSNRRCSENDIKKDYSPSKQSLPFLPKSPKCLKPGHLAKVISKNGRVVIGRVRYVGVLASNDYPEDETFVGLQLPNKVGDCDGSINGRKFFDCEPQQGIFVPFKKIVMAWTA